MTLTIELHCDRCQTDIQLNADGLLACPCTEAGHGDPIDINKHYRTSLTHMQAMDWHIVSVANTDYRSKLKAQSSP
jgi:hypothetical protein